MSEKSGLCPKNDGFVVEFGRGWMKRGIYAQKTKFLLHNLGVDEEKEQSMPRK